MGKVGNKVVVGGGDVVVLSSSLLNRDLNIPGILNYILYKNRRNLSNWGSYSIRQAVKDAARLSSCGRWSRRWNSKHLHNLLGKGRPLLRIRLTSKQNNFDKFVQRPTSNSIQTALLIFLPLLDACLFHRAVVFGEHYRTVPERISQECQQ